MQTPHPSPMHNPRSPCTLQSTCTRPCKHSCTPSPRSCRRLPACPFRGAARPCLPMLSLRQRPSRPGLRFTAPSAHHSTSRALPSTPTLPSEHRRLRTTTTTPVRLRATDRPAWRSRRGYTPSSPPVDPCERKRRRRTRAFRKVCHCTTTPTSKARASRPMTRWKSIRNMCLRSSVFPRSTKT